MTGNMKEIGKEEKGSVQVVEASFIFPIMFIILFFLIYMGNAFYVKAQVESVVAQKAIEGANYCADPLLEYIRENGGKVPELKDLEVKPYRYLFGGMDDIEKEIEEEVKEEINSGYFSFFSNMKPTVTSDSGKIARYNNYVFYSTFSVDVKCKLPLPIRFLGSDKAYVLTLSSHAEYAVDDAVEFIRNTDMIIDYFGDSKLGRSIKDVFNKINTFLGSFASM